MERKLAAFPDPAPQMTNFSESVRTRQTFALNEQNGHRSCNIINIGLAALRLGRNLKFDPVKQEFIDDEGANRLINPVMRAPFTI
ncbi:hypothetical protein D3C87_1707200 [compost metagenome]